MAINRLEGDLNRLLSNGNSRNEGTSLERLASLLGAPSSGMKTVGTQNLTLTSPQGGSGGLLNVGPDSVPASGAETGGAMDQLLRQMTELIAVTRVQADQVEENTLAVIENSVAKASGGIGAAASNVGKTALSLFGGTFGLVSVLGKLFGGGETTKASPTSYSLPESLQLEAAYSPFSQNVAPLRYSQSGLPEAVPSAVPRQAPAVTVQVQAMDSRSFLDHSTEIARAVKEALLNSHSLNDVLQDY